MHMAQLMPLQLTVSCFSKIQIGFNFLVPAHLGSPGKGPLNGCVCTLKRAQQLDWLTAKMNVKWQISTPSEKSLCGEIPNSKADLHPRLLQRCHLQQH